MRTTKTYCFIFVRAGSKGLPNKNVRLLAGKPLLSYPIHLAKTLPFIDKIFVSTDSSEAMNIAKRNNVAVIPRPEELASDNANEFDAWKHAISWVIDNVGHFDNFISLPCTAPLRTKNSVSQCFEIFNQKNLFVVSVTKTKYNPFFNLVKKDIQDSSINLLSPSKITRRQDAPEIFCITPIAYIAKQEEIIQRKNFWDGKIVGVEVPSDIATDIDDLNDFLLAEAVITNQNNKCSKDLS